MAEVIKKRLVTVANRNGESNVFTLEKEFQEEALLSHPLAPHAYLKKPLRELDIAPATPKTSYERCLEYVSNSKDYFDFERKAEIECLCTTFVINRKFTDRLRLLLVRLVGIPAKIEFRHSIQEAVAFVNKNKALLDDYHNSVYNNKTYYPIFSGSARPEDKRQAETVFNVAGFLLAQINTK